MLTCIDAVKARLAQAAEKPEVIESILAAAIAADFGAARMAAIEAAKTSPKLRKLYDEKALRPEVQAELQAIWPATAPLRKRRRVV